MPRSKVIDGCQLDDCGEPTVARGLCSQHYYQERKAGRLEQHDRVTVSRVTVSREADAVDVPVPGMTLAQRLDLQRLEESIANRPTPCKRDCCWTPFGHSAAARGCTCHTRGTRG